MSKCISLSSQERGELVLRLLRNEATASELAREHSISEPTLHQWRTSFLEAGFAGLSDGRRTNSDRQHQRELAKRDQVIGELTVALRVLKKTWGSRHDAGVARSRERRAEGLEGSDSPGRTAEDRRSSLRQRRTRCACAEIA